LFTDLVDSTRMYREIGDATAFGLVMNHFDVLRDAIRNEDGAIVKTIGDAVMAVFRRPISAVRAVHTAQHQLAQMGGIRPLHLKAAIHYGPSIAVTLNEQLDYFGSTINVASRLEKFSQGSDIILSDTVYNDPEVADYLSGDDAPSCFELIETTLKGYDEECFTIWRVDVAPGLTPATQHDIT
ncbi:MAG: adenylate/guanylate cyclase domain-containing protein, partial [Chloroflexi bacterium]|nr:adenylate/guanylate cyclase domain-containing protein [Chloroflexota bacterium]